MTLEIVGLGRTLFCHGTPDSDTAVITTATPESRLREIVAGLEADVVVCGHTRARRRSAEPSAKHSPLGLAVREASSLA